MNLDTLIANLDLPEEADRMYAAEDLGYANDPAGIVPLCNRLKIEPSRAVKEAILAALERIQHPQVLVAVTELLQSDDVFICNQAILLLAGRGAAALPHVETILREGNDRVRKLAVDVLCRIQVPGIEELYRVALRDSNPNIVITAVEGIGANKAKMLKAELENIFNQSPEPMLLTAVLETLSVVGDENSLDLILGRFPELPVVPGMLQYSVIKTVGCLGGSRHAPRIIRLLEEGNARLAQPVVDALINLRTRVPSFQWPQNLLDTILGLLDRNIAEVLRYQILVLLWHGQPGDELEARLEVEVQRLKNPELIEALEEKRSKLAAL